jgi:serine/threonine protein kinase
MAPGMAPGQQADRELLQRFEVQKFLGKGSYGSVYVLPNRPRDMRSKDPPGAAQGTTTTNAMRSRWQHTRGSRTPMGLSFLVSENPCPATGVCGTCSFRVRRLSDNKVYALKETNVKHMSSVRRVHPDHTTAFC